MAMLQDLIAQMERLMAEIAFLGDVVPKQAQEQISRHIQLAIKV
jgi:hypothetical protein